MRNMLIGYLGFEFVNQAWSNTTKVLLLYSNYTNPLKVDDEILENLLKIYPNPTSNILVIDSKIPLDKVELYSILGNKVKECYSHFNAIPVYDISAGIYTVKIQSKNKTVLKKIIKI